MTTKTAGPNFDFMRWAGLMGTISVVLCALSIGLIATKGLNLGLEFTGGTVLEVEGKQDVSLDVVRSALEEGGYDDAVAQHFGSARDVMVRIPPQKNVSDAEGGDEVGHEAFALLAEHIAELSLTRVEFVGPQVGDELRDQSGLAVLIAMGMMMLYLWFRFTNKFGLAAVLALAHDVILVLGLFALFGWTFDLTILAAVLAVVGYSVNDTIVIADHIREDFRGSRLSEAKDLINRAVNRTLSRTMITGLTTLLVLVALYVFGGEMIRGFSIALIAGVIIGTYSSIYVANGILLLLGITKEDFMLPDMEELDDMP